LAPLRVHFTQGPSAETLRQYLTGLLSEHPNTNCDTLAEVVPETNEQQFNHLLTDMMWDESALNRQRIARMQMLPSEGDVAAVRASFSVSVGRGPASPVLRADALLAAQPLQDLADHRLERRSQRLVAGQVCGAALLAGRW
jgi:hypothetical protein